MLRPRKKNSGVSFNDTVLNFGLRSAVNYSQQGCRVRRTDDLELVFCLNGKNLTIFLSLTVCVLLSRENTKMNLLKY